MHLRFEYFEAFEERQDHKTHTPRGLVPIFSRDAESLWKRGGIKHVAHDAVSFLLSREYISITKRMAGQQKNGGRRSPHTL